MNALRRPGPSNLLGKAGRGFVALLLVVLALLIPHAALAQSFPPLTGRVVDAAGLLNAQERAALEAKLKAHEDRTTDQVVVATVRSLEGTTVEDYANRLFRHWQLGRTDKDNGALLLVAPNERKVRIEVGYGLEGALTDALSKVIITTAIAPQFQKGDFAGGIDAGTDAILSILTGDAEEWQRRAVPEEIDPILYLVPIFFLILFAFILFSILYQVFTGKGVQRRHRTRGGRWVTTSSPAAWSGGSSWRGGSSWGGGGGGFSGGGGSSGGGGASGSW